MSFLDKIKFIIQEDCSHFKAWINKPKSNHFSSLFIRFLIYACLTIFTIQSIGFCLENQKKRKRSSQRQSFNT